MFGQAPPQVLAMIVPRAFRYAPQHQIPSSMQDERVMAAKAGSSRIGKPRLPGDETTIRSSKLIKIRSIPTATPSIPVLIPTRSEGLRMFPRRDPAKSCSRSRQHGNCPRHNKAVEPSMASLLASTAIPASSHASCSRREGVCHERYSNRQITKGTEPDEARNPSSSCSPRSWDLLQDLSKDNEADKWSLGSDSIRAAPYSSRSMSDDSIPSSISDFDMSSSMSSPRTPGITTTTRARREKSLSSMQAENCGIDHPLSSGYNDAPPFGSPHPSDIETLTPDVVMLNISSRPSLISNLTASIRVLKTAAMSFSNFTAHPHEPIGRPLLSDSLKFTDDRRPSPLNEVPDLATRRYLNPVIASPADMHIHHDHDQHRNKCTTSIQLQTYHRKGPSSKNATSPAIFAPSTLGTSEGGSPLTQHLPPSRQREPRENSNFLRVIVLEMNMRKAGKMEDAAPGKARIWLPPRQSARIEEPELSTIPRRWSGIVI